MGRAISMGIGFNSEVLYDNTKYHVQTEDMSPNAEIVSHVYQQGTILFTKRTSYADATEESKPDVAKDLAIKQHNTIVQVIQQGGIPFLKSLTDKQEIRKPVAKVESPRRVMIPRQEGQEEQLGQTPPTKPPAPEKEHLVLELLTAKEFYEGQREELRILARTDRTKKPLAGVKIVIKLLGITFRPVIFSGRTDANGLFRTYLSFPSPRIGHVTLEISAFSEYREAELRFNVKKR